MNVYKVIRRLVNIHSGVIAIDPATAEQFGKSLKNIGNDCYEVKEPIQLLKDTVLGYDGELYPFNVKKVSHDKLVAAMSEVAGAYTGGANKKVSEENVSAILGVIDDLDKDKDFTSGGKPEIEALKALLDRKVNAAERDEAWRRYQDATQSGDDEAGNDGDDDDSNEVPGVNDEEPDGNSDADADESNSEAQE